MMPTAYLERCLGALLAISVLFSTFANAQEWVPVAGPDNIEIHRREYPGSLLQEIRAVTLVDASLNAVVALLRDAPSNARWVYRSGGAWILEENGFEQVYVYGIVDAPWPIQDRDAVVRFDYRQDAQTGDITINITNFPAYIPPKRGYVRVPEMGGAWTLRPQADGKVEVTYHIYGDPGGWLPEWMANYSALVSVERTLENMHTAVGYYTAAQSEFVRERPQ